MIAIVDITRTQLLAIWMPLLLLPIGGAIAVFGMLRAFFALHAPLSIVQTSQGVRERSLVAPVNAIGLGGWIVGVGAAFAIATGLWAQHHYELAEPGRAMLMLGVIAMVCALGLIFITMRGRAAIRTFIDNPPPKLQL